MSQTATKKLSENARVFDSTNANWHSDPQYVMLFLRAQQNYAQEVLNARAHLFLNEVYDMLGFPRTSQGQLVGWLRGDTVDFGFTIRMADSQDPIQLDFNVRGVIHDKI